MLLREMSDAHLEIAPYFVPPMVGDEDTVMLLSGDICTAHSLGANVHQFFQSLKRFKAVVYIPGNHEYYREHIDKGDQKIKDWLKENGYDNVHYLNMDSVVIEDVAFVGATLWTDIARGNPIAKIDVENGLNDYRVIRAAGYRKLRGNDTICKHIVHKNYLFEKVQEYRSIGVRRTVVMSHHAPSELSVHSKYKGSHLNPAYYSNLEDEVMDKGADYHFHGHTHDNFRYTLGATEVICNPRGYAQILRKMDFVEMMDMEPVDPDNTDHGKVMAKFHGIWHHENAHFDPFLRIEI